ncbi:MAG: hypothetical protein IT198_11020 [Acidimicrobiia bacterium]|nr:hypothetical protein [Acidimicrobiia bacterium]
MTDSDKNPDLVDDASDAARTAFDALTATSPPAEAAATAATAAPPTTGRSDPAPSSTATPRPFSKTLDEPGGDGEPVSITWAAGFGTPHASGAAHSTPGRDETGTGRAGRRRRRGDRAGVDPELVRKAESVEAGASSRATRLKQAGIVAAVLVATAMATLIVASAFRGPAREAARLEEETKLNGLGTGEEVLPDPVPAGEEGPPKTAPPSTAANSTQTSGSQSTGSVESSTVKTAPPSTVGSSLITPGGGGDQQVVYLVSGLGLTFTTTAGNCSDFEGNPLCAHVALEVGERLVISRIGDGEPATNIWLLDSTGALALVGEGDGFWTFEAKAPVDKGNIVIYAEGVIPLFIDFAVGD